MIWGWPPFERRDVPAILVLVFVVAIIAIRLLVPQRHAVNSGFGPEWRCSQVATTNEPVCVKGAKPVLHQTYP